MNGYAVVRDDPDYANIAVFTETQADAEQWALELGAPYSIVLVDGVCVWCHQAPVEESDDFCSEQCHGLWLAFRNRQEDTESLEREQEWGS